MEVRNKARCRWQVLLTTGRLMVMMVGWEWWW